MEAVPLHRNGTDARTELLSSVATYRPSKEGAGDLIQAEVCLNTI
jgi:hypothetical protein